MEKFASISSYWKDEAAILDLRGFRTRVEEHMEKYKRNELKVLEDGMQSMNTQNYLRLKPPAGAKKKM